MKLSTPLIKLFLNTLPENPVVQGKSGGHLVSRVRVRDRSPKGREGRSYPALGPLGGKIAA